MVSRHPLDGSVIVVTPAPGSRSARRDEDGTTVATDIAHLSATGELRDRDTETTSAERPFFNVE
jgi:hypothetical protein